MKGEDMDQASIIEEPGIGGRFRGSLESASADPLALVRGELPLPPGLAARWETGKARPHDFIWTTLAIPVLVSAKVVGLLQEVGATGWSAPPIPLFGKQGEAIPGYHLLTVHGRCGPVRDGRSARVMKPYPGGPFPVWRGLYAEPGTWDGSDLYMPEGGAGWIFVSPRMRSKLERARVGNVVFTSTDEVERAALLSPTR